MKRIFALVLTLIMIFCLTGCKKNDPTLEPEYKDGQGNVSGVDLSTFEGKSIKPYLEMVASKNFYYQKTDTDGNTFTFTRIGDDEKFADNNGNSFIKTADGRIYYVKGKYYLEFTDELVEESSLQTYYQSVKIILASYEELVMGMLEFVPIVDETVSNIAAQQGYTHEEYKDIENNVAYSFFFDQSGTLSAVFEISTNTEELTSASYKVSMGEPSPNAISNVFATYTLVDNMTALEGAAEMNGQGTTATTQAATQAATQATTQAVTQAQTIK